MNWMQKKIADSERYQQEAFSSINELIVTKRNAQRHITLDDGRTLVDFMSCSYLGLDMDKRIIKAASNNLEQCGFTLPCARTRARIKSFTILEDLLNQIFCNGYSTTFSSVHLCHLALLPLIGSGKEIPCLL